MEPEKFDYNKLRDETAVPAIKQIFKSFAENIDLIVYDSKEEREAIMSKQAEMCQKVLEILIENKVVENDMKYVVESIQTIIFLLFTGVAKQKMEIEKEFLARAIGARDPGTGKFTRENATLGDLFEATTRIRKEQDKDGNQYIPGV